MLNLHQNVPRIDPEFRVVSRGDSNSHSELKMVIDSTTGSKIEEYEEEFLDFLQRKKAIGMTELSLATNSKPMKIRWNGLMTLLKG